MFFAESLGGIFTDVAQRAVHAAMRAKFAAKEVSQRDLAAAIGATIEKDRIPVSVDTALNTLTNRGWIAPRESKSGRTYTIKATQD